MIIILVEIFQWNQLIKNWTTLMNSTYIPTTNMHKCEFLCLRSLTWIKPHEINYQSLFQKACIEIFPNFWQIVSLSVLCILAHSSKIPGFTIVEWDMMQRVHHISFHYLSCTRFDSQGNEPYLQWHLQCSQAFLGPVHVSWVLSHSLDPAPVL